MTDGTGSSTSKTLLRDLKHASSMYIAILARNQSYIVDVAERSKAPRSGRGLFGGVGSNPTVDNGFFAYFFVYLALCAPSLSLSFSLSL